MFRRPQSIVSGAIDAVNDDGVDSAARGFDIQTQAFAAWREKIQAWAAEQAGELRDRAVVGGQHDPIDAAALGRLHGARHIRRFKRSPSSFRSIAIWSSQVGRFSLGALARISQRSLSIHRGPPEIARGLTSYAAAIMPCTV